MTEARIYDVDIGKDPDDTCVAAMLARQPARFRPTLVLTNDETPSFARARFLADMLGAPGRGLIAAGLPTPRRVRDCLVERAGLVEAAPGDIVTDGVLQLLRALDCHDTTLYFSLGALTNLAAALALRPDLAPRVRLAQMGPALASAYHRPSPQYNARIDPVSFSTVLGLVPDPALLLAHVTWARFGGAGGARLELGVYPDDPLGRALLSAEHPTLRRFGRHLAAWFESGFACSIMHDPLTVLGQLEEGLVAWESAEIWIGEDGFADRERLDGRGRMIHARVARTVDYAAARLAICAALLDASPSDASSLARAWGVHNAARPDPEARGGAVG